MTKAEVIKFLANLDDDDEVIEITGVDADPWDIYDEIVDETDDPDLDDFDEYMAEREGLSKCMIRKADLIEAFDWCGEDNVDQAVKYLAQSWCDYPINTAKYEWVVGVA